MHLNKREISFFLYIYNSIVKIIEYWKNTQNPRYVRGENRLKNNTINKANT